MSSLFYLSLDMKSFYEQAKHLADGLDEFSLQHVATLDAIKAVEKEIYELGVKEESAEVAVATKERSILIEYADKPKELGSNEETRKAKIKELSETERNILLEARENQKEAKFRLAQLQRDLERTKYMTNVFFKLVDLLPMLKEDSND